MFSVTVIVLLATRARVQAKEISPKNMADAHDFRAEMVDKLVDSLFDRVVEKALKVRHLHDSDLQNTTLALIPKTLRGTPFSRSVLPYRPTFRDAFRLRNEPARHSAQVRAFVPQPEMVEAANNAMQWIVHALVEAKPYLIQAAIVYFAFNTLRPLLMQGGKTAPEDIRGNEDIMRKKEHGTCPKPVQSDLRWGCDTKTADRICAFNRHGAEYAGYFTGTSFVEDVTEDEKPSESEPVTFYDSVTGKPLFKAPVGRSWDSFVMESRIHGWPSFRDDEVVKDNVRVLADGETVSVDGTHLGHNLPDGSGNRYCINLVSVAGRPEIDVEVAKSE